jgi:hypothetical protein
MSTDAAKAMWPHLATKDGDGLRQVPDHGARPEWGKKEPLWSEPRQVIKDYSKVPGLVPKVKR